MISTTTNYNKNPAWLYWPRAILLATAILSTAATSTAEDNQHRLSEVVSFENIQWGHLNPLRGDKSPGAAENVYPREVEDVLYEHPDVLEAAVIGIPDEKWGERVHAILVTEKGRTPDLADILIFARERLAAYKVPKSGEFMNDLPKNATGKILKPELRKPYWGSEERGIA